MSEQQSIGKISIKRRIVFACLMGVVTTGLVSLTVVLINLGFTKTFWQVWLKSWSLAFLIVVPVILLASPAIQRFVDFLFRERIPRPGEQ